MIKWCFLWVLFPIALAQASSEFGATPAEQAMCQAVIYDGRDTSDRENWGHMHHFCDCVRFTNRAIGRTGAERNFEATRAVDNCDYVLSHAKPDFNMRGEIHLQKGKALNLQGKRGAASSEFLKALSINPDLIAAYVALSDNYAKNGVRKEALSFVIEGLKRAPNSRVLQRRYAELGGTLPYPEPLTRAAPTPVAPPEQVSPPADAEPSTKNIPPSEDKNVNSESSNNAPATDGPASTSSPIPTNETPTGTPSSPWCRFCPPS